MDVGNQLWWSGPPPVLQVNLFVFFACVEKPGLFRLRAWENVTLLCDVCLQGNQDQDENRTAAGFSSFCCCGGCHCCCFFLFSFNTDRLVGLVVMASASRAEDPWFKSRWHRDLSGSSYTSDFKIGTRVTTLPGAWRSRVSTGQSGVSIL